MKQILVILVFFLFGFLEVNAYSAESMIAIDMDSGRVLYEQNAYKEKLIASTTKIMTTIVAIEKLDLNTIIKVDERVLKSYGSGIYIEVGEELTLKDLLYGLMLRSGNDAAIVIANAVGGSMESFAYLMNQKAYELGMSHTTFYNAHGLEEGDGSGNTSTAYDMALLMRYAMQNEHFREITKTLDYEAKSNQKTYHWTNKNKLLRMYPYTIGGKTGFTEKARRTLVTAASKEGRNIVIVTLNDGNDFQDHQNLYEVLFQKYEAVSVLKKDQVEIPKFDFYHNDRLYLEKDVVLLASKEEISDIHVTYEMDQLENYKSGDMVGSAHILLQNKELMAVKVYVQKKSEEKKEGFFQKFFGWLFGW
ncbi:MAG: D-alanyl-D-alanine carboxypeptidase [Bacilli bacterium]|nr:D-alanyl-D-alanine carboxypeptidase [Bacilli bacterium]